MKTGFAKIDITPRTGVELCGFGPFLNRHSVGIRDRLWARAMALEIDGERVIILSCDLIGISGVTTRKVRDILTAKQGLAEDRILLCCSHTHSGPGSGVYIGWGEADPPYMEILPFRIAQAAMDALDRLEKAHVSACIAPCEGIGLNREYETFWAPYDEALDTGWRPEKAELTDTQSYVLAARNDRDELLGFIAYFGCHPVVCCDKNRMIHGDYPGVALNNVERDYPGAVGLFLQGANGDVNTAIGGRSEQESLLALDVLAGRFARSIRFGLAKAERIDVESFATVRREVVFSRKDWSQDEIRQKLNECEAKATAPSSDGPPSDSTGTVRMNRVYAIALRRLLGRLDRGETLAPKTELFGLRLGPVAFLGSPFETFQAIKRDVCDQAVAPVPMVVSFANDSTGYAVDSATAQRGGYAADMVPLICGELPFAGIHEELVRELLRLDAELERQMDEGNV